LRIYPKGAHGTVAFALINRPTCREGDLIVQRCKNSKLLHSLDNIRKVLDMICEKHEYSVLGRLEHQFDPQGITIIYLLSESHISVHTFPEKNYLALDIYTCREYPDNEVYLKIYEYLHHCTFSMRNQHHLAHS